MILYVNCCVREGSRTAALAENLISKLGGQCTEINIGKENIQPLSRERLEKRTELIAKGDYSSEIFDYAKQFAAADKIVIAAPYWDLSFPSILKIYIENIFVTGITFRYSEEGIPVGLCKAEKLYYVTTAGGPYVPDFSYGYVRSAADMLGIKNTELIKADMLDIIGNDPDKILKEAMKII